MKCTHSWHYNDTFYSGIHKACPRCRVVMHKLEGQKKWEVCTDVDADDIL